MAMSWLCVLSGSVPCIEDCRGRAPARIVSNGVNSGENFDMWPLLLLRIVCNAPCLPLT